MDLDAVTDAFGFLFDTVGENGLLIIGMVVLAGIWAFAYLMLED